jgi:hypothetical protein
MNILSDEVKKHLENVILNEFLFENYTDTEILNKMKNRILNVLDLPLDTPSEIVWTDSQHAKFTFTPTNKSFYFDMEITN